MTDTKRFIPMILAVLCTVPGFILKLMVPELSPPMTALITGIAILGSSFLLLWACDAAQKDVSHYYMIEIYYKRSVP